MRRYFITALCVLSNVMAMPIIMIMANNISNPLLSCSTLNSGLNFSINNTQPYTAAMAIKEAINPFITARLLMGLAINHLVAPTICIVFIIKRLLYMASLMVLSIENTTSVVKIIAVTKNITPTVFTNLLTLVTVSVGN